MNVYCFYDADVFGAREQDIKGQEYHKLLNTCFRYCKYVSFCVNFDDIIIPKEVLQSQIPLSDEIRNTYMAHTSSNPDRVICLQTTETVCKWVQMVTDRVFDWIYRSEMKNPEDIAFFRDDNSVFFITDVHNGKCMLSIKEGEDVVEVINCGVWEEERPPYKVLN